VNHRKWKREKSDCNADKTEAFSALKHIWSGSQRGRGDWISCIHSRIKHLQSSRQIKPFLIKRPLRRRNKVRKKIKSRDNASSRDQTHNETWVEEGGDTLN